MVVIEDLAGEKEVQFSPPDNETFAEWARVSHLKEGTLDVLRSNDIDNLTTVRLLNADDIKRLPIKLGQAKLLEYAVKKLKRSDTSGGSLNTSKDASRGSSPDRRSDSFYIVPSPGKHGSSPSKVEVDEDLDDQENSPCTIRITIETKKEEDPFIEDFIKPRNILEDLIETEDKMLEEPDAQDNGKDSGDAPGEEPEEAPVEEIPEEAPVEEIPEVAPAEEIPEDAPVEGVPVEDAPVEGDVTPVPQEDPEDGDFPPPADDPAKPPDELDDTRTDVDLEVKGESILPPPPPEPIEVPPEVKRVIIEANEADLITPVLISNDRRQLTIPCPDSVGGIPREELIKNAARRIVAESIAENGPPKPEDICGTQERLAQFFSGAYGSTLIRLSNDHGTLKFLVPQLSEAGIQTCDECVEEEGEKEEGQGEEVGAEDGGEFKDLDSISGELATPLVDNAEEAEERDRMPDPPAIDEPGAIQKPVGIARRESVDFDPANNPNVGPNFHTPKEVNRFGNYMQVQMLGEDLHNPPTARRPMSPVVCQPIRWECNRAEKGSPPKGSPPNKNASPVRHRTPSPQRSFRSPDRARGRVTNGIPAGTAYKASGEIDPRVQQSPPKEIVNKIRNNIESPAPKNRSPLKARSPSPVKPFDTEAFRLARKLAQEVADCPPDCIMVRVKDLQKCPKALLPPELDKAVLEEYISDTEFRRALGMSRADFGTYSEWKQQEIKKELGLF